MFLIGGRRLSPTSSAWQRLLKNHRGTECRYTATSERSLFLPTHNWWHNRHGGQYLHKNKVGGYAYNDANMLMMKIERVLERKLSEDFSDKMKGLVSNNINALTE